MKLISTEEFHARPLDALPWIVEAFAVRGSTILLYGRQGIGKSSLAWQLAHALTTGAPWLGFPIVQTGAVVWLNLDMPHLEMREMLSRAADAGMPPNARILVPDVGELDEFDILGESAAAVLAACRAVQPIAVVVDTAADAFLPKPGRDINAEVRAVIRALRRCVPNGVLVLLLHDRKRSAFQSDDANRADLDAFLGPTAWEAKATSSFRLTHGHSESHELHINKTRLARPTDAILQLEATEHGFFHARPSAVQALLAWTGPAVSEREICRRVAQAINEDEEAVRKALYRAKRRGIRFPWAVGTPRGDMPKSDPSMSPGQPVA